MPRLPLAELRRRCQKPDARRVGNWMARRISRPAALRVTWVVAPWGVSASVVTLVAWATAVAAAAAFGWGTIGGWLAGAALLQLWYLLDHVDGQLARLRGTASLDGAQLDYLMHHAVNLLVPAGVGFGLLLDRLEPIWMLVGLAWGLGLLLITLRHDARYKAFAGRLKRVRGGLLVEGGACPPVAQPPIPKTPARLAAWLARKLCEMHVVMNLLGLVALGQWLAGDRTLLAGRIYAAAMALVALLVAGWTIGRSLARQEAQSEFATWYRPAPGERLTPVDGWWVVEGHDAEE